MTLLAAAALAALSTAAPAPIIPTATLDDRLEVTGEGLAARQIRSRMLIAVEIDGKGPFRFLVDSGADRTVIGTALARQLGLPAGRSVTLQGIAGSSRVETVKIGVLTLGRSRIEDIAAPVLAEVNLGAQGILGIDALADQRLMFDFDARTVTVQDTRVAARFDPDEIVVTARRRKGQLILTQAAAGRVPIHAVVDTGAELTMGNLALRDRVFAGRKPPRATPITLISVTGATVEAARRHRARKCRDRFRRRAAIRAVRPRQAACRTARHRSVAGLQARRTRFPPSPHPLRTAALARRTLAC